MKKLVLLLYLISTLSFSQEKTYLDFINGMTPVFPGCENAKDKSECLLKGIGTIIISRLNKEHQITPIADEKILINLSIRIEKDGKTTILSLNTSNEVIKKLASSALENLPIIQPLYSERDKENVTSSQTFSINIHKTAKNNFELFIPTPAVDPSTKPYPNFELSKHIGISGCEDVKKENFSKCFNEQINIWISDKMNQKLLNKFKGQKAKLKLVFDREGKLNFTITTDSVEIKEELTRIFNNFPIVAPAETNGEKSTISYMVPIAF